MRGQRLFGILNIIVTVSFDNSNMFYFGEMVGLGIERVREFRKKQVIASDISLIRLTISVRKAQ
jgi:hypothetical protein